MVESKKPEFSSQSGQTSVEYVMLLVVVMGFFGAVLTALGRLGMQDRLLDPLQKRYAAAYRYGHPDALGYGDGGPKKHPRAAQTGNGNFRLFIPKR